MEEGATLCGGGQPHLKVAPLLQGNVFFGKIPWPRPIGGDGNRIIPRGGELDPGKKSK